MTCTCCSEGICKIKVSIYNKFYHVSYYYFLLPAIFSVCIVTNISCSLRLWKIPSFAYLKFSEGNHLRCEHAYYFQLSQNKVAKISDVKQIFLCSVSAILHQEELL